MYDYYMHIFTLKFVDHSDFKLQRRTIYTTWFKGYILHISQHKQEDILNLYISYILTVIKFTLYICKIPFVDKDKYELSSEKNIFSILTSSFPSPACKWNSYCVTSKMKYFDVDLWIWIGYDTPYKEFINRRGMKSQFHFTFNIFNCELNLNVNLYIVFKIYNRIQFVFGYSICITVFLFYGLKKNKCIYIYYIIKTI